MNASLAMKDQRSLFHAVTSIADNASATIYAGNWQIRQGVVSSAEIVAALAGIHAEIKAAGKRPSSRTMLYYGGRGY